MVRVKGSDRRKLFRELVADDWSIEVRGGHIHARSPEGKLVILCHSPSVQKDFQRDLALLKRYGFRAVKKGGKCRAA